MKLQNFRLHGRSRTSHLTLLTAALQVPWSSAHPYAHAGAPLDPTRTAYEIADGQVQVPGIGPTAPDNVQLQSGSATFPITSTVHVRTCLTPYSDSASSPLPSGISSYDSISSFLSVRDGATTETILETIFSTTSTTADGLDYMPMPAATSSEIADLSTDAALAATTILFTSSIPDSSLTTLTTFAVQTATEAPPENTTGFVLTSLETQGAPTSLPFPTSIINATSSLSLVDTATLAGVQPTDTAVVSSLSANDIFQPIATDVPASYIGSRSDHPAARLGIQPQKQRLHTNKFYGNLYLGSQTAPVFLFPYSVSWMKGAGETGSWGLAVSHTEPNQRAFGPARPGFDAGQSEYYTNPLGIQSLILSAIELGTQTVMTTDSLQAFSVNANLLASPGAPPTIRFPLLQGLSFITGIYSQATPLLQSGIGFSSITYVGTTANGLTHKYTALLKNNYTWVIYVTPSDPTYAGNTFTLASQRIQGPSNFNGLIQIAKLPGAASQDVQTIYDGSAGTFATSGDVSGSVDGTSGAYSLSWTKQGIQNQSLVMFALPHHLTSIGYSTIAGVTDLQLSTTVKGMATAIRGDLWELQELTLPIDMSFAPWSPELGSVKVVSSAAAEAINAAGTAELSQNMSTQTNQGSLYYDGKALAKFAAIVYSLYDIAENHTLALTGLQMLEDAFDVHVKNQMKWPLVYDDAWGGVVSSETYIDGNSGDEFGNTYYNDHHFHYGYFVYAAAVIGYLDPTWLHDSNNVAWVNLLIRDFANSVDDDQYFPFSRMFDWYHGHSWASGLFESFDGKNQESSSEDTMASYGIKMWGQIINDPNMEARGNLMLAVQARSLQSYYLYSSGNTIEPAEIIGNKVAGILFENKIDHTTYFGAGPSLVEGIHMLPIMPFSTLTRTSRFVLEEWNAYNWQNNIDTVSGGWKGILLANYAIVDPSYSYQVFLNSTGSFSSSFLDGGASQTWYLTWSAALGDADAARSNR